MWITGLIRSLNIYNTYGYKDKKVWITMCTSSMLSTPCVNSITVFCYPHLIHIIIHIVTHTISLFNRSRNLTECALDFMISIKHIFNHLACMYNCSMISATKFQSYLFQWFPKYFPAKIHGNMPG